MSDANEMEVLAQLDASRGRPDDSRPMMAKRAVQSQRLADSAGVPAVGGSASWPRLATFLLITTASLLLTLAGPPTSQAYLAWVALVPWLIAVNRPKSTWRTFWWNWYGGLVFFTANIWWLMKVTVPGGIGLIIFCGFWFGIAAAVVRGCGLLKPASAGRSFAQIILIGATWVACEYVRGTFLSGMPWSFVAHTQTPVLMMCQIADIAGAYGVTFWVVAVNVALFQLSQRPRQRVPVLTQCGFAIGLTVLIAGYGLWRMSGTNPSAGPTVLVVQPNYPQSYDGTKSGTKEETLAFHLTKTEEAIAKEEAAGGRIDLVVWSETIMRELNPEARQAEREFETGNFLAETHERLSSLASKYRVGLLTGGVYGNDWAIKPRTVNGAKHEYLIPGDIRNSAFFYDDTGTQSEKRYDKIHLVPFGETIPFHKSLPWLHDVLLSFGPADLGDNMLVAGASDALTVFELHRGRADSTLVPWRFVTPICFEDADGGLVASMFRPDAESAGGKRADMIINITNDGWFAGPQMRQHLNKAIFRSIENRVPTARAVNTGISGFIDSVGRTTGLLGTDVEGTSVARLAIDDRLTVYSRIGDVFAWTCVGVTSGMSTLEVAAAMIRRKAGRARMNEGTAQ